jgi:2-polyprenyl-3-methyl-5-hydroxy-6-metoxy-1,4-benzoquinol methylase
MLNRLREMWQQRRNRESLYSTAAYWDSKAETLKGKAVSMWPNNHLNALYEREAEAVIRRFLGDVRGRSILDLGCGTGRMSRWFAAQGARVVGVDFSAGALAIAKGESVGDNPSYRLGSIFELADENAYDIVFAWGVVTTACREESQVLDALVRIRRSLRDGGKLLLTEPIHKGFLHRVLDMDLRSFLGVMRKAGFDLTATAPMHFWPARLTLSYVQWPAWLTRPVYWIGQGAMRLPGLSRLGDYWAILATPAASARAG